MFYRSGASSSIRRSEFPSCPEKRHSEAVFKPPQLWISRISSRFSRRMTVPRGRFGGQNVIVMYSCIDLAFGNSRQVQLSVGKHASILHMMSLLRCMAVCIPLLKARDNITLRLGNSSSIPSHGLETCFQNFPVTKSVYHHVPTCSNNQTVLNAPINMINPTKSGGFLKWRKWMIAGGTPMT